MFLVNEKKCSHMNKTVCLEWVDGPARGLMRKEIFKVNFRGKVQVYLLISARRGTFISPSFLLILWFNDPRTNSKDNPVKLNAIKNAIIHPWNYQIRFDFMGAVASSKLHDTF